MKEIVLTQNISLALHQEYFLNPFESDEHDK